MSEGPVQSRKPSDFRDFYLSGLEDKQSFAGAVITNGLNLNDNV